MRVFLFLALVCSVVCHIQFVEKEALRQSPTFVMDGEDFDFTYPFDLDAQEKSGVNSVEDARFVSAFLARRDADWVKFTVAPGTTANANAAAWSPACRQSDDIYVNVALLGPLTDSRFQPITSQERRDYNIDFEVPAGYGAVLGINRPENKRNGEVRPTLNITLPAGEFPNKWFIPFDSGELCQGAIDFRAANNDESTGKLGCAFPAERCPGRAYPNEASCDNSTFPAGVAFCPHFMVGNFCGAKSTWRWINERALGAGTYYYVFWERNGKSTDVGYMMGYKETLRFGTNTLDPECVGVNAQNIPAKCVCGTKNNLELPVGCSPLFPFSRARIGILYPLLTNGGVWHDRCDYVDW